MKDKLKVLLNTPVSLFKGLKVTITNMVRTKTTVAYPEVMPVPAGQAKPTDPSDAFARPYEIAPRFRGLHGLTKDETGDLNCIGCMACAKVCPDDLISMTLEKREGHSGRFPVTFTVNIGPCCFCGLCAEVCPTPHRAIVMTDLFEWASYRRDGANLVLRREDLEKHGDYENERRKAGRQYDEQGRLIGVNPEEEGNPYFQFKAEYEAQRQGKSLLEVQQDEPKAAKAEKPAKEAKAAEASAAPAADPMAAVAEAFAAADRDVPANLGDFDLASLDTIEDRKLRAQCKSAIMKARKAAEAGAQPVAAPAAEATPEAPAEDPFTVLQTVFEAAGRPLPEDVNAFDLTNLDDVEDRKLRGQLKSAIMKARKAGDAPPAEVATGAVAEPEPEAAAGEAGAAEREALVAALTTAGIPVPEQPETLNLDALDGIEDRKLRGQAKSALRKLQRALGLVD